MSKKVQERKSSYFKPFKMEYCDMLLKHMESGLSFHSFAGVIPISIGTLYDWLNTIPEFEEASHVGESLLTLTNEKMLMMAMTGKMEIKESLLIFKLKNQNGWRNEIELKISNSEKYNAPDFLLPDNHDDSDDIQTTGTLLDEA